MKRFLILTLVVAMLLTGCVFNPDSVRQSHSEPEPAPEEPASETVNDWLLPHEQEAADETPEPEAQPEPEVQPEPAPAAQPQPAPQTVYDQLLTTDQGRYTVNIFLSNFSEQGFHLGYVWPTDAGSTFYSANGDIMEMVAFAWINGKINENAVDLVDVGGEYYYGVDLSTIDYLVNRYFGRRVTELDIRPLEQYGYTFYRYIDGKVCCPAADGETYNTLTITDQMTDLGDGTYRADFHTYTVAIDGSGALIDVGGPVTDKTLYELTAAEAGSHWGLSVSGSGSAVVRPFTTVNGTQTYQLVSYTLYS